MGNGLLRTFGTRDGIGRNLTLPRCALAATVGLCLALAAEPSRAQGTRTTVPDVAANVDVTASLSRAEVAEIQRLLAAAGFDPGGADGAIGPKTREAVGRYQAAVGLTVSGTLTAETVTALYERRQAPAAVTELTREEIVALQEGLNRLGMAAGTPDGVVGANTLRAIIAFLAIERREPGGVSLREAHDLVVAKARTVRGGAAGTGSAATAQPPAASALGRAEIAMLEQVLASMGHDPGPVDGVVTIETERASRALLGAMAAQPGSAPVDQLFELILAPQLAAQGKFFPPAVAGDQARTTAYGPADVRAVAEDYVVSYRPAPLALSEIVDGSEQDRLVATYLALPAATPVRSGNLEALPYNDWVRREGLTYNSAATVQRPPWRIIVSPEHDELVRRLERFDPREGTGAALADDYAALLGRTEERYGASHPAVGVVLDDIARLGAEMANAGTGDPDTLARIRAEGEAAARLLLGSAVSGQALQEAIVGLGTYRLLLDVRSDPDEVFYGCNTRADAAAVAAAFRTAAAHRYRQAGTSVDILDWLATAASCSAERSSRMDLIALRFALAAEAGEAAVAARTLFALGREAFEAGDHGRARTILGQGLALAVSHRFDREGFEALSPYVSADRPELAVILRELGMVNELGFMAARMVLHDITLPEATAWNYNEFVVAAFVEEAQLFSLADAFYASQSEQRDRLERMGLYALNWLAEERYGLALSIARRGLALAEEAGEVDRIVEFHARIARGLDESGALDEALETAQAGLVVAQRASLDNGEDVDVLRDILRRSRVEQGDRQSAARELAAEFDLKLDEACSEESTSYFMTRLPIAVFQADPLLEAAFMDTEAPRRLIECFNRLRGSLDGLLPPWSTTLNATTVTDVLYLLGRANDREGADAVLRFLMFEADWNAQRSDQALLQMLPDGYLRHVPASERLPQARQSARGAKLIALVAALDGLLLGDRSAWMEPYRADLEPMLRELVQASEGFGLITGSDNPASETLLSFGFDELASMARERLRDPQTAGRETCGGKWDCEMAIAAALERGDRAAADSFAMALKSSLISHWAGASMDSFEADQMTTLAIAEGIQHENAGRLFLAKTYYEIAVEDHRAGSQDNEVDNLDRLRVASALARIALADGDADAALALTRPVVSAARGRLVGASVPGSDSLIRWAARLRDLFEAHLDALPADEAGVIAGTEDDFFALQYLQTTRPALTIAKLAARRSERADPALVRRYQDNTAELGALQTRLVIVGDADVLSRVDALQQENRELLAAIGEDDPSFSAAESVRFPSLRDIRDGLRDGEAMLVAFAGRANGYLWLITRAGDRLQRIADADTSIGGFADGIRAQVGCYLAISDGAESLPSGCPDGVALGDARWDLDVYARPYEAVIGPFEPLLSGVDRLLYVPTGAFDQLPLAVLLRRPAEGPMTAAGMRSAALPWLVRDMTVSVLPSVASAEVLVSRGAGDGAAPSFLGIGNPDFGAGVSVASLRTRSAGSDRLRISALPETETEIVKIAAALGEVADTRLVLGGEASEPMLRDLDLSAYDIITFATHAILANEIPGLAEPAIILSLPAAPDGADDGFLRASEVVNLQLNADLIILSACNTAGDDGSPGAAGLSGLANAFFYAGARSLVATHWKIPSAPAVDLSVEMIYFAEPSGYTDWAYALRFAQLNVLDAGRANEAHPANWGAHIAIGR